MAISMLSELQERRLVATHNDQSIMRKVLVCAGSACTANGSRKVHAELLRYAEEFQLPVQVSLENDHEGGHENNSTYIATSSCHGFCEMGPLVQILPDGILYVKVKPEDAKTIVEETLIHNRVVEKLLYLNPMSKERSSGRKDTPFFAGQTRTILSRNGLIDPESLDAYLAAGGFVALEKALFSMTPQQVRKEVETAGLRGRGGAGFPTGMKWNLCAAESASEKYIIGNADEGDPGAFMNRSMMEGDPFSVLEGLMIAGYAIGASKGIVYVRQEYPLAVKRLENGIKLLRQEGLIGENILNSGFKFDIQLKMGAGAFVCGEETALMQSIEGKRGSPKPRPPFPAQSGLFGKPTTINNVETLANVPHIISNGAEWYRTIGTEKSKGTKVFALTGKINVTGLVEVSMGTTIRHIIYDIGGGIPKNKRFKAVQMGGPSGGCVSVENLDLPIDYESLRSVGAMMGSGGMVVMDETTCIVDVARYFINFCADESCGKCVPCREGVKRLEMLLTKITEGNGELEDLALIEDLCVHIQKSSLCALGQTAVNPILSTLRYFRDEYLAHIVDKRCPAGVCKSLITFTITEKCTGCEVCARNCPVNAISGERRKLHFIDQQLCTRCGTCTAVCAFDAITVE